MATAATVALDLQVADVSGQKVATIHEVPEDSTVGELIDDVLPQMSLPENDIGGRPLVYHARLHREGRHLNTSERVLEAVQVGDKLVLQPNVEAGSS